MFILVNIMNIDNYSFKQNKAFTCYLLIHSVYWCLLLAPSTSNGYCNFLCPSTSKGYVNFRAKYQLWYMTLLGPDTSSCMTHNAQY